MGLLTKIFGTYSERELKKIDKIVCKVESLADKYSRMTDAELSGMTSIFKERLANGETLDDILPDAFAAVREAADRVLGKRPFRVQIIGGIILHQGRIAEMKTGEGKTLVATMPAYLNALTGEGVHIVTVNDYLATRDSEEMGRVYGFMGLTTGIVVPDQDPEEKRAAYQADITYCTNNELGFDYLRDNMVVYKVQQFQRGHAFAIVDEVDSILIDEARTPLIISGPGQPSTELYAKADSLVRKFKKLVIKELDTKKDADSKKDMEDDENESSRVSFKDTFKSFTKDSKEDIEEVDADYIVEEKAKNAVLTARGTRKVEEYFGIENLSDIENNEIAHHINQAIRAHGIMKRDVDYVVNENGVVIVDAFTGRLMPGRRYSNGLHQAIEAKEGVQIEKENQTLASITFQNYFRMYKKLSGMTGTALTEDAEFREIYTLDIVEVPTNKPMIRVDHNDALYKDEPSKFKAIVEQVKECHKKGQPVLVGTVSVEKSEAISKMLIKEGIKHNVLNAKFHEKEADIIAQAGRLGAVTIATNMAGRGTDIMLGGNSEYMAKQEMKKRKIPKVLISLSTGNTVIDDEEILNARRIFTDINKRLTRDKSASIGIFSPAERIRNANGNGIYGQSFGNTEQMARIEMGRKGFSSVLVFLATGAQPYTEKDILEAKRIFAELNNQFKAEIEPEAQKVREAGGLFIIGSERHESRRIDNQLRGRSGRQGDPGESRFFISAEDDVLRLFGSSKMDLLSKSVGMLDGEAFDIKVFSNLIENAQKNVENMNFKRRKNVIAYDDVMNKQRELIYKQRQDVLNDVDISAKILEMIGTTVADRAYECYDESEKTVDVAKLENMFASLLEDEYPREEIEVLAKSHKMDDISELLAERSEKVYRSKDENIGVDIMRHFESNILLKVVDRCWMEHIDAMDDLRESVALQSYAQRDPVNEYRFRAAEMFEELVNEIRNSTAMAVLSIKKTTPDVERKQIGKPMHASSSGEPVRKVKTVVNKGQKIGRNDPCPCGSGKKYKQCCGMGK